MDNIALILLLVSLCVNCKSSEKSGEKSSILSTIEKTDQKYDTTLNESGDYILYVQHEASAASERITFFVIDAKSKQKIVEKSIRPGYVKWIELYIIEFLDVPGMLAADEDLSAYIKKININDLKR